MKTGSECDQLVLRQRNQQVPASQPHADQCNKKSKVRGFV